MIENDFKLWGRVWRLRMEGPGHFSVLRAPHRLRSLVTVPAQVEEQALLVELLARDPDGLQESRSGHTEVRVPTSMGMGHRTSSDGAWQRDPWYEGAGRGIIVPMAAIIDSQDVVVEVGCRNLPAFLLNV